MYRRRGKSWIKHMDFMLLDMFCLQTAFVVSYVFRFGAENPYGDSDYRSLALVFVLIDFFVEIFFDSFRNVLKRGYMKELTATCRHVLLVELLTSFYLFSTQMGEIYSRLSYYMMIPLYIAASFTGRVIWKKVLRREGLPSGRRSLLVLAPEEGLADCLETVSRSPFGYSRISAAALDADRKGECICGIPIVADSGGIMDYACSEWVDEILFPPCGHDDRLDRMARQFMEMGITVHSGIAGQDGLPGIRRQVGKAGGYTVVTASLNYATSMQLFIKRLMDITGGLVGCFLTLLLLVIFGPMIYISSPGPIFFAQERIGRNGRKFRMYKLRTMYPDAEERKKELVEKNRVRDGMMFKLDFDPRIIGNRILPDGTRKEGIGSFLRKTSLDEFPQFFNVLKGDMSLVGTRPPTVDEWERYKPHHRARMSFRSGMTGLWQVSGRSRITDFEKVVKLDTRYIDEWSLGMDVKILFKTVGMVLKDEGAM